MPTGPKGEKRPADVIGNAVHVMKIATGEIQDVDTSARLKERASKGGDARAVKLTKEQRTEIARVAAEARWKKS